MSTIGQLNQVCFALRRLWTNKEGSMAILRDKRDSVVYRVCCGIISNPNIIAERCKIWAGDDKVYDGSLTGASIWHSVDTSRICSAEILTARMLNNGKSGSKICCGRKCVKCTKCRMRC